MYLGSISRRWDGRFYEANMRDHCGVNLRHEKESGSFQDFMKFAGGASLESTNVSRLKKIVKRQNI